MNVIGQCKTCGGSVGNCSCLLTVNPPTFTCAKCGKSTIGFSSSKNVCNCYNLPQMIDDVLEEHKELFEDLAEFEKYEKDNAPKETDTDSLFKETKRLAALKRIADIASWTVHGSRIYKAMPQISVAAEFYFELMQAYREYEKLKGE